MQSQETIKEYNIYYFTLAKKKSILSIVFILDYSVQMAQSLAYYKQEKYEHEPILKYYYGHF